MRIGRGERAVVAVVAAGGALGALARFEAGVIWPTGRGTFPWTTVVVNVAGSLLIGIVLVLVTEHRTDAHPLIRPFVATGVLGGFTTFSTFSLDAALLVRDGEVGRAVLYLVLTVAGAIAAVFVGIRGTRRVLNVGGAR